MQSMVPRSQTMTSFGQNVRKNRGDDGLPQKRAAPLRYLAAINLNPKAMTDFRANISFALEKDLTKLSNMPGGPATEAYFTRSQSEARALGYLSCCK